MKILGTISQFLIPIIIGIGVIDAGHGIKTIPYLFFIISVIVLTSVTIRSKNRNVFIDILTLILVFLSLIDICNLILCILYPPVNLAVDCEGHQIQSTGYFLPSIVNSLITTTILGFILFRREKKINQLDKISMSSIAIVLLMILSFPIIADKYDEWKWNLEKPEERLPPECE